MGFLPRDVDEMTIWEFNACCAAFSNDNDSGSELSDDAMRDLGIVGF